jgi:hypothetical protein
LQVTSTPFLLQRIKGQRVLTITPAIRRPRETSMKGFIFATVLIFFGGVLSGINAQAIGRGQTSILFELKPGQTRNIPGSKAKIKFVNVMEDSRCPEGTNCIWAGNARLKFRVSDGRKTKIFDLNTDKGSTDFSFDGYQIRLVKLSPKTKDGAHARSRGYVATLTAIPPGTTGKG